METITQRKRRNSAHQPVGCWCRPDKRLAIYLRDHFKCVFCNRDLTGARPEELSLDHITPREQGGDNHESNLVTACHRCNSCRQNKPIKMMLTADQLKKLAVRVIQPLDTYRRLAKMILGGFIDKRAAIERCK